MYIIGYTVNGKDYGIRSWYYDSVWAIEPKEDFSSTMNVFRDYKTAEEYYKKAHVEFRRNLKPEHRGGRIWIRKVGSIKNPFKLNLPIDLNNLKFDKWIKVKFALKTT